MDIQFYGANCLTITTKQARLVIDDNLAELGAKPVIKEGDIALYTQNHPLPSAMTKLLIDSPGEYEVSGVNVQGIAARAHTDEAGQHNATMYRIISDDVRIVITGHIFPELTNAQLELLDSVDVLVIPVGNSGYTLDSAGALEVIKRIEPKLVIPTHYGDKTLHYPVPQVSLEEALKGLAMEPKASLAKLRVKPSELTDTTQLIVLERQ